MRIRIVLSGAVSAVFCLIALWFPWYMAGPAEIAPDWSFGSEAALLPEWVLTGAAVFCGLTLFAFGWVSARWSWAENWRESLLAGVGAGVIAGCLIYNFIGAFHFGLLGQKPVLLNFYREVTETEGLNLLVSAISGTAVQMYMGFLALAACCAAASGLGGLVSAVDTADVWGKPPRRTDSWLFRLSAYGLTLNGAACLVLSIAIFSVLQESAVDAWIENELQDLSSYPFLITLSSYLAGMTLVLFPLSITWGWAIHEWRNAGLWRVSYAIWTLATLILVVWMTRGIFDSYDLVSFPLPLGFTLPLLWTVVPASMGIGLWLGYLSKPVNSSELTYNASDWLGYALTQGVLGGTQLFLSAPAYAVAIMVVTFRNIPHLTQSGIVDRSPAQQIMSLSETLSLTAWVVIILGILGGLVFGVVVRWARKFLKISPVTPLPEPAE